MLLLKGGKYDKKHKCIEPAQPLEETTYSNGDKKAWGYATSGKRKGGGRENSTGRREIGGEEGDHGAQTDDRGT